MKRYTKQEDKFLIQNYNKLSRVELANKLNKSVGSIRSVLKRLKLKNSKEQIIKKQIKYNKKERGEFNVDERLFIENINKNTSYLLGILWADGYLGMKKTKQNNINYRINLSIQKNGDGEYVRPIIETTGKWSINITKNNSNPTNPMYSFHCFNPILGKFLQNNDYKIKSGASPNKILLKIPKDLIPYFFLGYLDGDGCMYSKPERHDFRIIFTSVYNQNWLFLAKLCKKLNCSYTIRRKIKKDKNSKFSDFQLFGSKNCYKLSRYIYGGHNMGFPRKREKFEQIKNYIKNSIKNNNHKWKNYDKIFLECLN